MTPLIQRIDLIADGLAQARNGDAERLHDLLCETIAVVRALAHEVNDLRDKAPSEPIVPDTCKAKTCDYYTHYLVHYDKKRNGARLVHEAFHAATARCKESHERLFEWYKANPNRENQSLERQCEFWEKRVAA